MNLNLIKETLAALKGDNKGGSKLIWKPKEGTQNIRFLPYKFNLEWPFTELSFHYDITGGSILSPEVFGDPDPINEFAATLKKTGDKEDYFLSRKIQSKPRWYAPILVREEETEGVRFWGFSKTIFEQILKFAEDEDFGDFTDLKNGRDFKIDFTKAANAESYPDTTIAPKMKTTPVTTNSEVAAMIKDMPDVKTLFKTMTYAELQQKLEAFLKGAPANDSTADTSTDTVIEDDEDDILDAAFKPSDVTAKPTKTTPTATPIEDMDSAFASMFDE